MAGERSLIPVEHIARAILVVRGHRVILDSQLAALYGVPTKRLNEQVKRNGERFPPDFAFQVTREEYAALRSQSATLADRSGDPAADDAAGRATAEDRVQGWGVAMKRPAAGYPRGFGHAR
jgi:hypothetical protein